MAERKYSIKASAGDFNSVTAWAADLDNATNYNSGDDAVGEVFDFISEASQVSVILGDTIGLNSISLISDPGSRHDGTPGGAAGINYTGSGDEAIIRIDPPNIDTNTSWLEFDGNGDDPVQHVVYEKGTGGTATSDLTANNLMYRVAGVKVRGSINLGNRGFVASALGNRCINNIIFDIAPSTQTNFGAIWDTNTGTEAWVYNNTIFNVDHSNSARIAKGMATVDLAVKHYKNNLVIDVTNSGAGTALCYVPAMEFGTGESATNGSEDSTGSSGLTSLSSSEFVNSSLGSEDLHLASGSTSEDAGTDAGTTPAGVEIDIDGEDRTAVTNWDIGAHEFELPAAAAAVIPELVMAQYQPG